MPLNIRQIRRRLRCNSPAVILQLYQHSTKSARTSICYDTRHTVLLEVRYGFDPRYQLSKSRCAVPHTKRWSVLVNFRNGSATSTKSGKNFDKYWTRPRNDLTSEVFYGSSAFRIAATFSSLGCTPDLLRSCPKNVSFSSLN